MRYLSIILLLAFCTLGAHAYPAPDVDDVNVSTNLTLRDTFADAHPEIVELDDYEYPQLEARRTKDEDLPKGCHCDGTQGKGNYAAVREGVKHIRKGFNGQPSRFKPRKCYRLTCSHMTAIRMCNDNNHIFELPSWNNIADGAMVVADNCRGKLDMLGGYLDHAWDHWRVFVDDAWDRPCN
ncbi:hypothetical protein BDV19DRAFT_394820 [Aspergillus venezuelensis]